MKYVVISFLFIYMNSPVFSQNISGEWKGSIDVNGNQLPIIFYFKKDDSGKIDGKWDSPKQNAIGLPFSDIELKEDSIHLGIKMIAGSYSGAFANADSITGIWEQGGNKIPLNVSRQSENSHAKKAVFVYPGEKEISIISAAGSKLYGTLLSKNNQQKIAIIVAGSGPTDRDGNSTMAPPTNEYKMLAHSLDSQNIATFRYDKRGVSKSASPDFKEKDIVFDDYVKDAEKIFDYLHDTLGFKDIYFIGHSEGSLIAMLASQKKKVKGYISIAGAGRPIDIILEEQMQHQPLPDSVKQQIPGIFNQLKLGNEVDNIPDVLAPLFRKSVQPYMISWLKYSPQKEIEKLKCPILILQGGCDIQVKTEDAENLHKANKKSTLDMITFMSHTLKNAGKDCVDEQITYTDEDMPLDNILVEDIVKFIEKGK
ncbi:MAG TPA: alpha/beta fold hydrolase [Hanamia sp.]